MTVGAAVPGLDEVVVEEVVLDDVILVVVLVEMADVVGGKIIDTSDIPEP